MRKIRIIAVSLPVIVSMTACRTDDVLQNNNLMLSSEEKTFESENNNIIPSTRMSSSILNANSAWDIPTQNFHAAQIYKNNYVHLKQPDAVSCSWTSYVVVAGTIAKAKGYSYTVNTNHVYNVRNWCNNNTNTPNSILSLESYRASNDPDKVFGNRVSFSKNSNGRFAFVKKILNHISTKQTPFLVTSRLGNTGHFYIVWSVNWVQGGAGSVVYYTDVNSPAQSSFSNNVKSMNFTDFLNLMQTDNNNYYNALFLW